MPGRVKEGLSNLRLTCLLGLRLRCTAEIEVGHERLVYPDHDPLFILGKAIEWLRALQPELLQKL
jgi:hypothetical protein